MSRASNAAAISAEVFAALGDSTRLSLLKKLGDGEKRSISDLTEGSGLSRQAVSKHLRVLEVVGLVHSHPKGRENLYRLDPQPLNEARKFLDSVSEQWDIALQSLKDFVEGGEGCD